jgi:ABC-type transport system involved in cytochrome c biogenesis permease component
MFPLVAPVLIASTEATVGLFSEVPALDRVWLAFLIAFDVVFLTAAWLFGEYLFEE